MDSLADLCENCDHFVPLHPYPFAWEGEVPALWGHCVEMVADPHELNNRGPWSNHQCIFYPARFTPKVLPGYPDAQKIAHARATRARNRKIDVIATRTLALRALAQSLRAARCPTCGRKLWISAMWIGPELSQTMWCQTCGKVSL
jgi:hypothetical protein